MGCLQSQERPQFDSCYGGQKTNSLQRKPSTVRAEVKIIILGEPEVGKTAIRNRYAKENFISDHKLTIGADSLTKEFEANGVLITVQLWDTAGKPSLQAGSHFFRGADGCVLVFDVTNPTSFNNLQHWHDKFLRHTDRTDFVLLGNKSDLASQSAVVPYSDIKEWCDMLTAQHRQEGLGLVDDIQYFEVSAKENKNIDLAFATLTKNILKKKM
eukprot:TRINITY_DN17037_c0_g1_i1.p1 TRINITY_DN17037_c0_g1~~TRINITY_DN17037_c0_g1_i1.p1  ORF type:complete len:213 (+),score=19.89 TRINITY_DN17037_c0_g1_i1:54-692(+)